MKGRNFSTREGKKWQEKKRKKGKVRNEGDGKRSKNKNSLKK